MYRIVSSAITSRSGTFDRPVNGADAHTSRAPTAQAANRSAARVRATSGIAARPPISTRPPAVHFAYRFPSSDTARRGESRNDSLKRLKKCGWGSPVGLRLNGHSGHPWTNQSRRYHGVPTAIAPAAPASSDPSRLAAANARATHPRSDTPARAGSRSSSCRRRGRRPAARDRAAPDGPVRERRAQPCTRATSPPAGRCPVRSG